MTKKEKRNLQALKDVCENAVSYVGQANYDYRERIAMHNVRQAFDDFADGKKPKWQELDEEEME